MAKATSHTRNATDAATTPSGAALPASAGATAADEHPSPAPAADEARTAATVLQSKVTKLGQIRALLAAPGGASLAALCHATGWQSHSVRAALTGLRKAGCAVEKSKAEDGTTVYRLGAGTEGGQ